jgi:hypothetical protein
MATGIVSIAAADHGFDGISQALVVLAAAGLVLLAVWACSLGAISHWTSRRPRHRSGC